MSFDGASHSKPSCRCSKGKSSPKCGHGKHGKAKTYDDETPGFANAVYYPNWRVHSHPPSSLTLGFVSHVIYAFAWVKPDGTVYLSDEIVDDQMAVDGADGCIRAFTQLRTQYPGIKFLLSIGGGGDKGSGNFASVANDPGATGKFVETAMGLVDKYDLDGLDVNWEHPSNPKEGEDYINLLAGLRNVLPSPHYVLVSALSAGEWVLRNIDLPKAESYLDLIHVMTYDFSGPWTENSGHHCQLFTPARPHDAAAALSCHSAVMYMLGKGVPSRKILLGIPAYGRAFPGTYRAGQVVEPRTESLGANAVEPQVEFDYAELPRAGAIEGYDETIGAAFCVDESPGGAGFVTYDCPKSVRQKARFARAMNLGGLFYWHIASDAKNERSLVATGYKALYDL